MFLLFQFCEVLHPLILDMFVDICVLLGPFYEVSTKIGVLCTKFRRCFDEVLIKSRRSFDEDRGPSYEVSTKTCHITCDGSISNWSWRGILLCGTYSPSELCVCVCN